MILTQPIWLLLFLPFVLAIRLWTPASRFVLVLRIIAVTLVLLAMAGLAIPLKSRTGTLVIVADQSHSMPRDSRQRQKELIGLLQSKMGSKDRMAVVAFGQDALIQQAPQSGSFGGWTAKVNADGSNLSAALQLGLSLIPNDTSGRVLILSDGRWTGNDPAQMVSLAASGGVALDYFSMKRSVANDVAIAKVDSPRSVSPGDAFLMTAWIRVPVAQTVKYYLYKSGVLMSSGSKKLNAGTSPLLFRDKAAQAGTHRYTLKIVPSGKDPVLENNTARLLVGVRGQKPLLHLSRAPATSGLSRLLRSGKIPVVTMNPRKMDWTLASLSRFSAVLLENVPAQDIGLTGMKLLQRWVKETGAGLMMTGGQNSLAPGGYYKTPIDPLLPVSMELRREHRKLSLAIAVVLDRSGSMSARTPTGETKMALANQGTAQVVDLLGGLDEIGVLAVDSAPHVIVPITRITDKSTIKQRILSINSMGGGIYVYEGLKAAYNMLLHANSMTRHIILFADAADAEQPGKYKELLRKCKASNITVSVIGLGRDTDSDAAFLKDVARRGRGRAFFTAQADQLPRLFAQDTFVVARSTFIKEPVAFGMTPGMFSLVSQAFSTPPSLGGYNLTYLKNGATMAAQSKDKNKAPVVASWRVGLGRVLVYTGEVDGKFTGSVGRWREFGNWIGSLTRWTMGQNQKLPSHMMLQQRVRRGILNIDLMLDPEVKKHKLLSLPKVRILQGLPGATPKVLKSKMRWVSSHRLSVQIPLRGRHVSLATVQVPGSKPINLSPVTLPYSPEFAPRPRSKFLTTLASLARSTQGKERVQVSSIWADLPRKKRVFPLGHWLLLVTLLLLFLEVWERRSGILTSLRTWFQKDSVSKVVPASSAPVTATTPSSSQERSQAMQQAKNRAARKQQAPVVTTTTTEKPVKQKADEEEEESTVSAFKQASRRAKKRTKRE